MEWSFTTSPKPIQMEKNTRITMKQYLSSEQTVKLIELGFEKPKNVRWVLDVVNENTPSIQNIVKCYDYSIGELLSFLPENIAKENEMPSTLNISLLDGEWCVEYADFLGADFSFHSVEVIDAIFDILTKLKENGMI